MHWEFGPQGEGIHGFSVGTSWGGAILKNLLSYYIPGMVRSKREDELTWDFWANCKRVTGISWQTSTKRTVIVDPTNSICTASPRTWINTFLIDTRLVEATLSACNALRAASWWRAKIRWKTRTYGLSINISTLAVWSTRRRSTRIHIFQFRFWIYNNFT